MLLVHNKRVYFHLVDGDVREMAGALRDFETVCLPRAEFMRVHRSYIVNMLQVEELSSAGLRTFQGETLPVSRRSYPQLQRDYLALQTLSWMIWGMDIAKRLHPPPPAAGTGL